MKRLSDQTLYEILEVSVDAPPEEIERAWSRAVALYAPGSLATYTLVSPDEAQLLNNRIEEAKLVLLDPDARGRYDERIGVRPRHQAPVSPAAPPAGLATPWPPAQAVAPVEVAPGATAPVAPEPAASPPAPADEPSSQLTLPTVESSPAWPPLAVTSPAAAAAAAAAAEASAAEATATPSPEVGALGADQVEAPILPGLGAAASEAQPGAAGEPAPGQAASPAAAPAQPDPATPAEHGPPPIRLDVPAATPAPLAPAPAPEAAAFPAPPSPGTAALTGSPVGAGPAAPAPIPLRHELSAPRQLLVPEGAAWTGEMLRQVREARGLTLPQLSERTKVTRHHLENIEAEKFAALPAGVYLRGILLSLARELRLDGQRVARSYLDRLAAAQATAPKR